ncbi:MAG: carbohydrate binding domain-containing protein, partial [Armatimonadota bacterium]
MDLTMIARAGLGLLPVALVLAACAGDRAEAQEPNLIPNGSFEDEEEGKPTGWATHTWGGEAAFAYADSGRTGERCVMISSDEGADAGWHVTVPVELRSTYRLSGWIKTANVAAAAEGRAGRGALLNLHNLQPTATEVVSGTQDWTKVEVLLETGDNDAVQINCLFGGWGLCTGRAWFDDVRLELVDLASWEPSIAIDAGERGEPVSKYIYGQFIEHLGRCIYGGIWAEMLEDRKFFDAVGAERSPWEAIGPAESVTMVTDDPFVGEHAPQVGLAGAGSAQGIAQSGLGLVKRRKYVGRIWLKGTKGAGPVTVSLVWGDGEGERDVVTTRLSTKYKETPLEFTAGGSTGDGRLEITAAGEGRLVIGTVSLMPADNVEGMRSDTLALLRELNSPVYRWPGGNFVSGYDWRDGIGPRDRRPPRKNPAWKGIEHNDFGIDEFMTFCRLLGTEPFVTVNSGLGEVDAAVEELQYTNAPAKTPMGKLRARNGHRKAYGVKWWAIGNEMYGRWQLGHMPLEEYTKKHNQFAEA